MKYPCDDCPFIEPDCPTTDCDAYDMWYWEESSDDS